MTDKSSSSISAEPTKPPRPTSLALYQPDIPQNAGTLLRLGACFGVDVHIIGPAGFRYDDKALKRAGLDYLDHATLVAHNSWEEFQSWAHDNKRRIVLATTKAQTSHLAFRFQPQDIILLGRESSGVPQSVHDAVSARLTIPMAKNMRSLNIAVAGALVLGEALRQTDGFPRT